ncbi:MAG: VOC family protein [Chloroflexi bacterium]|nr:VOC family protein [Chloroflexota bacterium]
MKLNHINLTVTDVLAAADFLEKYFGLQRQGGDQKFQLLFDDGGMVITLMKTGRDVKYPATFHIGFGQESEDQVNAVYQRLIDDGFEVEPPQRSHAWTFYVLAPGGFTVEVLC